VPSVASDSRCQLYRLLGEPVRLRLLALTATEELAVGELAELLGESQPNVSRHATALRQAGLLQSRREGTRVYVGLAESADPVVTDALQTGRRLCADDGSLERLPDVVRARDARTREFFSHPVDPAEPRGLPAELPGYLFALSAVLDHRDLAIDAGTGDGAWLDVLAPLFRRVVALDRSDAQLDRARRRITARGYANVTLLASEIDGPATRHAAGTGADVVICSRVLHHAPRPRQTVHALADLARPGGLVVLLDYAPHTDEHLQELQADVWMGFEPRELMSFARDAGLSDLATTRVPSAWVGGGPDHHLSWQVLTGRRRERSRSPRTGNQP
jgi:DNA-binding transcriptional ArsR family regulator